jgi:hypothetical protein
MTGREGTAGNHYKTAYSTAILGTFQMYFFNFFLVLFSNKLAAGKKL